MDVFELLPNETINHIISHLDIVAFWKFGSTCHRLIGFRSLTDKQWRQKYAQKYYLNEEEIAVYSLHHNWEEMYKMRYMKELSFMKEIEKARKDNATSQSTSKNDQTDEDSDSDNYDDMFYIMDPVRRDHPVLHALFKNTLKWEERSRVFKPEFNPWYTLLKSEEINEIKHAINNIHYSLLRGEMRDSYEMIDVLVTVLSKNLKTHPELAEHLQYQNLGVYLYRKPLNFPYTQVAMGSINLLIDHLHENSPYLEGLLDSLKNMPYKCKKELHTKPSTDRSALDPAIFQIWFVLNIPVRISALLKKLQRLPEGNNRTKAMEIAEEILLEWEEA